MATLFTRSITNTSSTVTLNLFIPGYDRHNPVTVAPSTTLDLLTVIDEETLHAMQGQLNALVADGSATVAAQISSSNLWPAALYTYLAGNDTKIVFNPTSGSATHTAGFTVAIQVENAGGAIDTFDSTTTVVVTATPTGASVPLLNGHASPLTVTMANGVASVLVTANIADTETLSLSSPSRSLTVSSTAVITLS
jgi:hypothetical protein